MNINNSLTKLSRRRELIVPSIITVALCSLFAIQTAHAEDSTPIPVVESLVNKDISVDTTSATGGSGMYTTLDSIKINNLSPDDGYQLRFGTKDIFSLDSSALSIISGSLSMNDLVCTTSVCTFNLSGTSDGNIEISGLKVRPKVTTIASSDFRLGGPTGLNLGLLKVIAGDAAKLNLEVPNSSQISIYGDSLSFSVKAQDKFGNETKINIPQTVKLYRHEANLDTEIASADVNNGIATFTNVKVGDAGSIALIAKADTLVSDIKNITVNKKELRINLQANDKVYDGGVSATLSASPSINSLDIVGQDDVTLDLTNKSVVFDNENIGTRNVILTGVALAGTKIGNYALPTQIKTTANITKKDVIITPDSGKSKIYGDDNSVFTYAKSGLIGSDDVTGLLSCNPKIAGKKIGVCTFDISSLSASSNYELKLAVNTAEGLILPKPIIITPKSNQSKIFGESDPVFEIEPVSLVGADSLSGSISRVQGESVARYDFILGSLSAGENYTLSLADGSPKFAIEKKAIVITPVATQKVYGDADPLFTYAPVSLVGSDELSGNISREAGNGVGEYRFILGTLSAGDNYNLSVAENPKFTITPKSILITPRNNQSKVYGESDPEFTYDFESLVEGDRFSGQLSRVSGDDVNSYNFELGSLSAGNNYSLSIASSPKFTITAKPVTVVANVVNGGKVYDASDIADVTLASNDLIPADNVEITKSEAKYSDKNVGVGKTVTVSGIALQNNDKGNYSLQNREASALGNITKKPITATVVVDNKNYDGTNAAVINSRALVGFISGDDVIISGGVAAFGNKNVGVDKAVSVTGLVLSGADEPNYSFDGTASASANIEKRAIVVNPVTDSRVYNGDDSSDKTPIVDITTPVAFGDTASFTQKYDDKNVGTSKLISVEGKVNDGNNGENYSYTLNSANLGEITARSMTVSAVYDKKVYDGTIDSNKAPIVIGSLQGSDTVKLSPVQIFESKLSGKGKVINAINYAINDGNDGKNYSITYVPFKSGEIEKANITITGISSIPKVYDGNTSAAIDYSRAELNGVIGSDKRDISFITDKAIATYDNSNAGKGKIVTIRGIELNGAGGANYSIPSSFAVNDGLINKQDVVVTPVVGQKKIYGSPDPVFEYTLDKSIGETQVILRRVLGENRGEYDFVVDNNNSNYNFILSGNAPKFTILAKPVTVIATVANGGKVYDANDSATVALTSNDVLAKDSISFGYAGARYSDKNYGLGKEITVTGVNLANNTSGNYALVSNVVRTSGNITAKPISVTVEVEDKAYDGTLQATIKTRTPVGVIGGDIVTVIGGIAQFADKNAGDNKSVSVTGLSLDGAGKNNYSISGNASASAKIEKRAIIVNPISDKKTFDGTKNSSKVPVLNTGSTLAAEDQMIAAEEFLSEHAGMTKLAIKSVAIKNGTTDVSSNYAITNGASIDGEIEKATPVIVWANPVDVTVGATLTATQLNAVANGIDGNPVVGTYVYTPAIGTVLNTVGVNNLKVVFTPTSEDYSTVEKTVTINVAASVSRGGGGGGGSISNSTSRTLQTSVQTNNTQSVNPGQVLGASTFNFTRDLTIGSKGDDVTELQDFLRGKGYLNTESTGYFGAATKAALYKYQSANGLPSTGYFGKATREKVAGEQNAMTSSSSSSETVEKKTLISRILSIIKDLKSKLTSKEEIAKYNQMEEILSKQ